MNSYWVAYASAQKIIETTKSLKICYLFNTNRISIHILRRRTEMTHQQRVSCSELLNVLLASDVNVHRLHLCWRTFCAHAVGLIQMM